MIDNRQFPGSRRACVLLLVRQICFYFTSSHDEYQEEFCNSDNLPCIVRVVMARLHVDSSTLDLILRAFNLQLIYSILESKANGPT